MDMMFEKGEIGVEKPYIFKFSKYRWLVLVLISLILYGRLFCG